MSNASLRTAGHQLFRTWWAAESRRRKAAGEPKLSRVAFAKLVQLGSGQAVSGWLRGVTRPDRQLWPTLRGLCDIPEDAWLTKEERAEDEARARAVAERAASC